MKKLFIILIMTLIFCPKCYAESDTIALLTKNGFFEKNISTYTNPYDEVRKTLCAHLKYSNTYNLEKLKTLYAKNYVNADGLNKDIYFDLVQKTWESYPGIKYRIEIKDIQVNGNAAVAQLNEYAIASTDAKSEEMSEKGLLESASSSVYYLENIDNEWKITSDYIIFEKTYLKYGAAKTVAINLDSPSQVAAGTDYTASLNIAIPKDTLIIASIGKENITYPQSSAEEVFRKMPNDGILERVFRANSQNINEYAVASFGMTKAEIKKGAELKIYITGLGFAMSRVNVIPTNSFVKVEKNEKS